MASREAPRFALDTHVHTRVSHDAVSTLREIERELARYDSSLGVCLLEHDLFSPVNWREGSLFIPGEEVLTSEENPRGRRIELGALGIKEKIPSNKNLWETIYTINWHGGIAVIVHPFDLWRHGAGENITREVIGYCLDRKCPVAVEVLNARATFGSNQKARALWEDFKNQGVLAVAGSDAHSVGEVGRAFVWANGKFPTNRDELIDFIRNGISLGECASLMTLWFRMLTRLQLLTKGKRDQYYYF